MTKTHWLLCRAKDFSAARRHVLSFFAGSMLVRYDTMEVSAEASCSGAQESFWSRIEAGIQANRRLVDGFLDELRAEGCETVADLKSLPQGYPSKLLHIIVHLLDGFIGIDSVFYNLLEDSHWLASATRDRILAAPAEYWLIQVEASFAQAADVSLIHHLPKA